jgi:hypothetical protein
MRVLIFVLGLVSCGYEQTGLPTGHEVMSMTAPDGYSRAFVWKPDASGGATGSQAFQVWIQYLRADKDKMIGNNVRRLVFENERTNGVKLAWKTPRELEICYGPSIIFRFLNTFEYYEKHNKQGYEVEIILRKERTLADC